METGCDLDARIGNFLRIERPKPIVPPAALMRWSANNPWEKFAEPSQELLHQNPPEPVAQKQSHKQPFKEIFPKRAKLNPSSSTRLVSVCKSPPRIGCPEPCAVCGAASTGYHYEVPSCNGCKTFFRRTVLAQRTFDCKKDGKCFSVLPKERRCICRACRFSKCVAVGMNPLAIISGQAPEDNILMQAIIKENIQTERLADQAVPMKCLASADDPVANLLERLMYLEVKHESIRRSTYNPRINPVTRLRDLLASPSELGKSYQEMPGWPISKECVKGTMPLPIEVYVRKRIPIPTSPGRDIPFNVKQWFFCDMVYSVEYVKTFDFFNELSSEDQLALLKNSVLQCVNLTSSFFSFQQRSDMIIWPDGRLKAESLRVKTWENLSEEARSLLIPARENYARSLLSYCLKKEGITRGPARFTAILAVFDLLCNQAQRVKELNVLLCALNLRPRKVPLFDDICQ